MNDEGWNRTLQRMHQPPWWKRWRRKIINFFKRGH